MSLNTLNYGNCNKVIRDGCPIEYVLSVLGKSGTVSSSIIYLKHQVL